MKHIYKERLLRLADLLEEISESILYTYPQTITFLRESDQHGFEAKYYRWAFYECPHLFREWHYKVEKRIPAPEIDYEVFINDDPVHDLAGVEKGTVWSAMFFFGLDEEVFLHLFGADPWAQSPSLFGGRVYPDPDKTKGTDIAFNIKKYLIKNEKTNEK